MYAKIETKTKISENYQELEIIEVRQIEFIKVEKGRIFIQDTVGGHTICNVELDEKTNIKIWCK